MTAIADIYQTKSIKNGDAERRLFCPLAGLFFFSPLPARAALFPVGFVQNYPQTVRQNGLKPQKSALSLRQTLRIVSDSSDGLALKMGTRRLIKGLEPSALSANCPRVLFNLFNVRRRVRIVRMVCHCPLWARSIVRACDQFVTNYPILFLRKERSDAE
jgi:hypothetical protein